jgi:lipoprotein NlpI
MAKSLFAVLLLFCLGGSVASATGYDEFADGMTAVSDGDSDRAIALFTSALASNDLNVKLVPVAYFQRGRAHLAKNECALAVSDLSAAMSKRADYLEAILLRGTAELCVDEEAAAIADLSAAIALRPGPDLYWQRGRIRWRTDDFAGASEDFAQTIRLEQKSKAPYPRLWFVISQLRVGALDEKELDDFYSGVDLDKWPGPLLEFFRGRATAEDVTRKAIADDAKVATGYRCEANFYLAEWWIIQHNAATAKPLLENARDTCPADFIELPAAKRELARLALSK